MNFLKAIIFGIIEGITEWMPISSTAHLKILNTFLPLKVSEGFFEVFEVVIQLGAILALLIVFWNKVWPFGKSNKPLGSGILENVKKDKFVLWIKIIVACLPAIIYELFIEDFINIVTPQNEMMIIGLALIMIGVVFVGVEYYIKNKKAFINSTRQISLLSALYIGLAQLIAAIIPGVSRSGATIICALLLGISRTCAVEFTYELAIPIMFGASLMKLLKAGLAFSVSEILIMLLASISAFVVSLLVIRFVLDYIKKNNFNIFGIYRVLLGLIVLVFLR